MQQNEMLGKVPPQSVDVENNLLGIIMMGEDSDNVIDSINPKAFYKEANKTIAKSIMNVALGNKRIDVLTVSEDLKNDGKLEEVGGKHYLFQLMQNIETSESIEQYFKIIHEKYILRELIGISNELSRKAFNNTESNELIADLTQRLIELSGFKSENINHVRVGIKKLFDLIEKNLKGENKLTGIPSGLVELDRFTNGFQKSDLIIIGGEPSNGKTSLALKIAKTASTLGHKTVIYSYEMSEIQLAARIVGMETGLSTKKLQYQRLKDYEFEQINGQVSKLTDIELYIDNVADSGFDYLIRSIRMMVLKQKAELIIIDYLQLIRNQIKKGNHAEEVADIANRLKGLAKSLDIPIILVSQLARVQGDPKPSIKRLKGSGDIEASADVILLPWRPEFYGIREFDCLGNSYNSDGLAYLGVAKGRNIGTTEIVLRFIDSVTLFADYEPNKLDNNSPY